MQDAVIVQTIFSRTVLGMLQKYIVEAILDIFHKHWVQNLFSFFTKVQIFTDKKIVTPTEL